MKCRHCGTELVHNFIDLGSAPPSNAYLNAADLHASEKWYPLRLLICDCCWLVQTEDYASADELFSPEYAYFSSYSSSWMRHAKAYVDEMVDRFGFDAQCRVVEVAANDGYLLQYVKDHGIPCYGIEPTASTAEAARKKGINIVEEFFSVSLAKELALAGRQADLIIANNVLAHVPDINDFVAGFGLILKPTGVATFEFPHLMRLVSENQFDTIYHEHYSYLSLTTVSKIFSENGLEVFDVEELATHGGSLRVFARCADNNAIPTSPNVMILLDREREAGMTTLAYYRNFQISANKVKNDFLSYLLEAKKEGLKVVAYGAAAKGNTLLNYAGVSRGLLPYVVDRNPAKQGMYLPGSQIPILCEPHLRTDRADRVVILPWNLKVEVMEQLVYIREWGGQFVTAVPELEVI